jgi:glycosyltransferase involved in cell wall biosynthesis
VGTILNLELLLHFDFTVVPIKILKFLTLFAVGGTERQFTYVTKSLDRSRFDVRVGCLEKEGRFLKEIEALNVPVSEYRITSLYAAATLRRQLRFAKDLRREGVQLVHAYGFYPNVFSVPAARLAGCATIASVRDTGVFTDRIRLKTLFQKTACRIADRVVANSKAVRDWLVGLGLNENHIEVIYNGIALGPEWIGPSDFPIRRQFRIASDEPVIAAVCRLNKSKGLEYFLEAAAIVSKRLPKARFLVVGSSYFDPEYKVALEKFAAQRNLGDRVIFTGERNDVPMLLKEVNVSVLPSLSEGLSNALLEAMAARLPVVATNVGGNPEVVQDGRSGLLVPARNSAALASAMIRILESPAMAAQFGKTGYELVKNHFSLDVTVRRTEELYMSVLERGRFVKN